MFYLDDLRLAEFRHSLSESQRIPEDKGEPECQMSVKPQRAEGSDGSGIPGLMEGLQVDISRVVIMTSSS